MRLKGELFEQLRDALLDAFNRETLPSMVRIELDVKPNEFVPQGTFRKQVEE